MTIFDKNATKGIIGIKIIFSNGKCKRTVGAEKSIAVVGVNSNKKTFIYLSRNVSGDVGK